MTNDPNGRDADRAASLKLWVVLSRAHEAMAERARADIERAGLSLTEFGVLEALYHKGDLTAGAVSRLVLLKSGSLTYVIDKLAERGLIRRRACDTDRRRTYLSLTARGRATMRKCWPGHAAAIQDATAGLSYAEKRVAARLLKRLGLFAGREPEREPEAGEIA
jgi:MarR family 2-MHQ and catechol resistance regulon transcriptional repressor